MLNFLFRKMWKNKWLLLCLLAGNILFIGIASATPMYSTATTTRMVHQAMRLRQAYENTYPVFTQLNLHLARAADPQDTYATTRDRVHAEIISSLAIPAEKTVRSYRITGWHIEPAFVRESRPLPRTVNLFSSENLDDNITLIYGRFPSPTPTFTNITYQRLDGTIETVRSEVIEVIAADELLFRRNLLVGELIRVTNVYDQEEGDPFLYMRIVGIFEVPYESFPFWAMFDVNFAETLLVNEELVQTRLIPQHDWSYRMTVTWNTVHDFMAMTGGNIPRYLDGIAAVNERVIPTGFWTFSENYYDTLQEHIARAGEFNITLIVLQVPLYFLLAFYMYVVSRKILQLEQNDISVLKSRGASRPQIFGMYVAQGFFVGAVAFPVGILFGVGVCRVLGASGGFLQLMARVPIVVEISSQALLFGAVAAAFSFFAMILPVIRFSRVAIVEHKLGKSGKPKKSLWQRYFLDIICLGAAIYGIYNFNVQQEIAAAGTDFIDPTLFLSSTLFMVGLGLFCLRIFPYIIKLVFWLGRRFMPISLYTALLRVARSAGEEQFIMIFLVFTMAIGIFSAQAARTINLNAEHEIRYLGGADLVVDETWLINEETWRDNRFLVFFQPGIDEFVFIEPNSDILMDFEEADSATRVLDERNNPLTSVTAVGRRGAGAGARVQDAMFMAIEPQSFGETVWFRDDLLQIHLNYYLNTLSQVPNGVLVSENFRGMGFTVGSILDINHTRIIPNPGDGPPLIVQNEAGPIVIVGFIERWPAFEPVTREELPDGNIIDVENSLIVGNLGYFRHQWGVFPYQVWLRTSTPTNQFFFDFFEGSNIRAGAIHDTENAVVLGRLDPLLQGTNGILTVNFIAALLICFTGFLIYWLLSIRERVLQFGIFRAMGLTMRSIIGLLINEQIFITITALIIGALVGEISARLYVPLLQMAYTNQVIPLIVVMQARDYTTLFIVMGAMILICLAVLIAFISKIRIDQALKLGED